MSCLIGCAGIEYCVLTIEAEIIDVDMESRDGSDGHHAIKAPEGLSRIGMIIEGAAFGNDQARHKGVHSQIRRLVESARPVKAQADIGPFAHVDQPARAESDLLPAASKCQARARTDRGLQVGKSLLEVESIDIGRRGQARRANQMIAELDEAAEGITDMQIGLKQ